MTDANDRGPEEPRLRKVSPQKAMEDRLMAVYMAATPEDIAAVNALVARATKAPPSAEVVSLTPGMCARLFFDHNRQNREWSWTATRDYLRDVENGHWKFTSQGIGLLVTGDVGDGQHRLGSWALSGRTIQVTVTFGMELEAVAYLDIVKNRQPADSLHILVHMGTADARAQSGIVKRTWPYLMKTRAGTPLAKRPYEYAELVKQYQATIQEAQQIGGASITGHAKPTLKKQDAQDLAFLCLVSGWPRPVIEAKLQHLQSGVDVGENSPFFVAAQILDRQAKTDELKRASSRYAVAIKAFLLDEDGQKAVRRATLKAVADPDGYPNPSYPQAKPENP